MAPFQLEWCHERVDSPPDESKHFTPIAVDCDFGAPDATATVDVYDSIKRVDSQSTDIPESFAHALEDENAIVAPLIGIIVGQKIGNARPVFPFDFAQKVFRVAIDLTLRFPKPKQKKANQEGETEAGIKAVPKPTGHAQNLLPKVEEFDAKTYG
jgi:hypothetical protein